MSQVDGMDPLFFTQCLCTSHRSYRLPDMRALEGSSPHKSTLHTHTITRESTHNFLNVARTSCVHVCILHLSSHAIAPSAVDFRIFNAFVDYY